MRRLWLIVPVATLMALAVPRPSPSAEQFAHAANDPSTYTAAVPVSRTIGARRSASPGQLRVQRYFAARFRAAGLRVDYERFTVPAADARATSSARSIPRRPA